MAILEIVDERGRQVRESHIVYEMDFVKEKEFSFNLHNTSDDDIIENLRYVTNMPDESYEVLQLTETIKPDTVGTFKIRIFREPLLKLVNEKNTKKRQRVSEFAYTRKVQVF